MPAGEIRHLDHDSPHGHETHKCGSSAELDWTTETREIEMSTDTARIQAETLRTLADHFDAMRRAGGSPQLDNALWHAASFTREQLAFVEAGTPNIFDTEGETYQ